MIRAPVESLRLHLVPVAELPWYRCVAV